MNYGSHANRVPAQGAGLVTDADVYKIGLMCNCVRGLADIQTEIYSMTDFVKKCGGYNTSYYGAYVAKTFFATLKPSVNVEMKVLGFVASDAAQATADIMDGDATPEKIFDIKAGRRGKIDKSAFGNDIAYKVTQTQNITFKLTADTSATPTAALLDQVTDLEVGYVVRFADGTNTEYATITEIDEALKQITFAALTNTYTASLTTVSRMDWNLYVAVKDDKGVYQEKEKWLDQAFVESDTIGMAGNVNHVTTGSEYVILAVNTGNSTPAVEDTIPAELTTWTALTGGSDGTASTDADWNTLVTSMPDESIMILLAPESTSSDHNSNMSVYATSGEKWMYYAQAGNAATEDSLKSLGGVLRGPVVFSMLPSDKWYKTDDPTKVGETIDVPSVGYDAAHWFNSFAIHGESKVSAGNKSRVNTSDKLIDDNGLVHNDTNGVGGRMIRNYSINLSQYRTGKGVTINSARTFSTDDGYRFQNQVMQTLLYKRSILSYFETIEQDKAGVRAQEAHYNKVWAYMYGKFKDGHLYQGKKEDGSDYKFEDVCILVNDFSNNTLADIANGIEQTFLQFVGPPPIEEPILNIASAGVTTVRG